MAEPHPAEEVDVDALREENRRWLEQQAAKAQVTLDRLGDYIVVDDDYCKPINNRRNFRVARINDEIPNGNYL